ncbi:hypothetical protein U1Q18_001648 [Sarracenia purpurea var. burkii]
MEFTAAVEAKQVQQQDKKSAVIRAQAAVAKFHADELVTDSPRVLSIIREKMNTCAKNFNIVIDNVAMLHISFKDAFHKAVEGKMVEQQEVERSKLLIAKA